MGTLSKTENWYTGVGEVVVVWMRGWYSKRRVVLEGSATIAHLSGVRLPTCCISLLEIYMWVLIGLAWSLFLTEV